MSRTFYVTADWSRLVPEGSPEAAFGIAEVDLARFGLSADSATAAEPTDTTFTQDPEPADEKAEEKQAARPADKRARKPANKSR